MIILIRHGQSEGNKNREIHQSVPDHRIKLTPEGHKQALEAGHRLRALLRPDDTLHFFTSPYRRTRETTEGILKSLTSDDPSPSPFPRHTIKVYEEPRLREQDFGNFQPCSAEMERMWQERADYGHFFYRIPTGESAADAYDRISGFNESLWRLFGEADFASVCVLVTHGLMARVFLMKWYHFSVEYFEDLRNVNHCEFVIMEKDPDSGKYALQTKLRTWSELSVERELEKKREPAKGLPDSETSPTLPSVTPIRRKWGGCPDGCNHGAAKVKTCRLGKQDNADLRRDDGGETSNGYSKDSNLRISPQASDLSMTKKVVAVKAHAVKVNKPTSLDSALDQASPHPTASLYNTSLTALAVPHVPSNPSTSASDDDILDNLSRPIGSGVRLSTGRDKGTFPPPNANDVSPPLKPLVLIRLGGRDGGGSKSGVDSVLASDDDVHPFTQNSNQPSQNAEDDGDDEGSGARRTRRPKLSRFSASNKQIGPRMANTLGDGDDGRPKASDDPAQRPMGYNDGDSLEME
ncbi:hypothetical protein Egran_01062 [Elaphomyces granulatus]|uniref:Uncharacterized protein n=1 Tax=Elaphomyces granulatus TaxID=519963 RepID=A0A232M4G9_9EURO|nr:hypothetical protein Egran_01062 [Elaphomyces granulatus]